MYIFFILSKLSQLYLHDKNEKVNIWLLHCVYSSVSTEVDIGI